LHVAPHEPPQSTSVSSLFFCPSRQCGGTQLPLPSHTRSFSVALGHPIPAVAKLIPHDTPSHVFVLQTVACFGQSSGTRHCAHAPLPSQSFPPLSSHFVPDAVLVVPHAPPVQAGAWHEVIDAGQSVAARHAAHFPLPSHFVPLLVAHTVPDATLFEPQLVPSHVATTQSFAGAGQSAVVVQATGGAASASPLAEASLTSVVVAVPVTSSPHARGANAKNAQISASRTTMGRRAARIS
jgi:hypothetical protein